MKIESIMVGPLGVNCYIASDPITKEAVVIDPGADGQELLDYIRQEGLVVRYIINTHGHADHIGANAELKASLPNALLCIHVADQSMLASAKENLSVYWDQNIISPPADELLADGMVLTFGQESLTVLHTPGHTSGGVCLLGSGVLFSGDTLFAGSVGRTDFPGGSMQQLLDGIHQKLLLLPDDTAVYPGHGGTTRIGWERENNPYFA